MTYAETTCYECDKVITEPLCEECFEREVQEWIKEKSIDANQRRVILETLKDTVQGVRLLPESNFFCIICNSKMHNICSYCLMKQVYNTINGYVEQEEMLLIFDYRIHDFGLQAG